MSASREKKRRQEQLATGSVNPRAAREAEQRAAEKPSSVLYTILGLLFGISFVFFLVEMNTVPVSVTGFGAYPYGRPKYDRWHRWNQTPPQQYGPGNWPPQGGGPGTTGPQDYYRS